MFKSTCNHQSPIKPISNLWKFRQIMGLDVYLCEIMDIPPFEYIFALFYQSTDLSFLLNWCLDHFLAVMVVVINFFLQIQAFFAVSHDPLTSCYITIAIQRFLHSLQGNYYPNTGLPFSNIFIPAFIWVLYLFVDFIIKVDEWQI